MRFDEWETLTLQDVCTTITDGAHFSPKEEPSGLPMASVKDLTRFGIEVANCKRISQEDFDNLVNQNCAPQIGDVLIAKDGNSSLDTVCIFNQKDRLVLLSSVAILRPNDRITSDYLFYYLDSVETRRFLKENFRSGSAIPRVILRDFRRAPIPVPPIEVQKAIANVLRPLDEKIELNRQTNATLEAIAQAIFKEWFVHYNYPGATGHLVDSELGPIPARWRVVTLEDVTSKIGSGATPRGGSNVYISEGVNLIRSQNVYDSEFVWSGLVHITEEHAEKLKNVTLKTGDVLINITGDSILRTCTVDKSMLPGRVNQHVAIVRPKPQIPTHFLHQFLLLPATKAKMLNMSSGATRKAMTKGTLENLEIILPAQNCLEAFENLTNPLFSRIQCNSQESRFLAQIRDVLLPKLMRGEIAI